MENCWLDTDGLARTEVAARTHGGTRRHSGRCQRVRSLARQPPCVVVADCRQWVSEIFDLLDSCA